LSEEQPLGIISAPMPPLRPLDELGIRHGTDKSSLQHDYLAKYERLFEPWRDASIALLEIGVFEGASLAMWEQYFGQATVIGVDIQPRCRAYEGGRRRVEIASQADTEAMASLGAKYRPTIVIDDGSHRADHILLSFRALFPHVQPGGVYVVEDMGFHAGPDAARMRGSVSTSPQQYFLALAAFACCDEGRGEVDESLAWSVEAVEFFHGAVVIRKKPAPEPDALEARRALVAEVDSHLAWGWLSGYAAGSHDESIAYARRAIELAPDDPSHHRQLYEALERANRWPEALESAETALRLWPGAPPLEAGVERIRAKIASGR
jgi:tetratricopeptide (TPR) repeat protein